MASNLLKGLFNKDTSYFKTFNQVQYQGGSMRTTTVIVGYFEDWPPRFNAEIGPEGTF